MPPPKKVLISNSVWLPTCDAGRLTSVRVPLSPPKNAPQRHMFCTVMLRCESRAGLGDPVEPVVKMTSAPSFSERVDRRCSRAAVSAGDSAMESATRRQAGSAMDAKDCVPGIEMSESTVMKCWMTGHCAARFARVPEN